MKKILAITTYNRKQTLERMAKSFREANLIDCETIIFDDCSTEFNRIYLSRLFPSARIVVNSENIGSDNNIRSMYKYFLKTDADILYSLDSDLIFHPDFVEIGLNLLKNTDGIVSLYNSFKHPAYDSLLCCGQKLLLKKHIGSAGTVFTRQIMKVIMDNVSLSRSFDWDWSAFLEKINVRILVSETSYIQHIGFTGYNTKHTFEMDYGLNFLPVTQINVKILLELLEISIIEGNGALKNKLEELDGIRDTVSWKITAPLRWLGKKITA